MGIVDKIGQPLVPGDFIAYGHALGRCAGIRIGKILDIKMKPGYDGWEVAAVDKPHITVRGIDDDWPKSGIRLCERNGTLLYPDRVIKLKPEDVPENYRKLFEQGWALKN